MDDSWIREFLRDAAAGVLGTVSNGQPFLNSNLFVYDGAGHCIYIHTARTGRTRSNVESDERVAFTAFEMGRLLPADEALEFSVEYAGVVAFGRGRVVEDPSEAERALQLLLDKYAPHLRPYRDYRPISADELGRTAVFRVDIDAWSGKQKVVEQDFPGALVYAPRQVAHDDQPGDVLEFVEGQD
jgi:nitroimidazol reductase NimA-like FMN-containing flavoprotein (pyridoxamine 5'-phosphate oxidase superfamily)